MAGTLYLIPVPLGPTPLEESLPASVLSVVRPLAHFIVEQPKSARATPQLKPERLCLCGSQVHALTVAQQFQLPETQGLCLVRDMVPIRLPIRELHQVSVGLAQPEPQMFVLEHQDRRLCERREAKKKETGEANRAANHGTQAREHAASLITDSPPVHRKVSI